MSTNLPPEITDIFSRLETPKVTFLNLMPILGHYLNCDRCFLYLRDPETSLGRVEFCWVRNDTISKIYDEKWKKEPETLADEDPMFAAALRTESSIFVEDVKSTDPEVLSREFEEKNFGHRALIHAHLCSCDQLWGVLQPCTFNYPRKWDPKERDVINQITLKITPIAVRYVRSTIKSRHSLFS